MNNMRTVCIIPTFNGGEDLRRLLDSLKSQNTNIDIMAVDSSSTDGSQELLEEYGIPTKTIKSENFNHGGTRQAMVNENENYDYYIFVTQDAYLENPDSICNLLAGFDDPTVGATYGRQLPHTEATKIASHARNYNYDVVKRLKDYNDRSCLGLKTAFISNSFAAYRGLALNRVGGFPSNVIFGEDMYVGAKMLLSGWKVLYNPDARCYHSHNYTIIQEFKRYFDMGVFFNRENWIVERFGSSRKEGYKFVISEINYMRNGLIYMWPEILLRTISKYLGYKLGCIEAHLPNSIKARLSMNKKFFRK